MTPAETARVLAAIAAFDQRTVGTSDVAAWHSVIHDLDVEIARKAVIRHYSQSTERIMPVHVREIVRQLAEEQAEFEWVARNAHDFERGEFGDDRCAHCSLPAGNRHHGKVG